MGSSGAKRRMKSGGKAAERQSGEGAGGVTSGGELQQQAGAGDRAATVEGGGLCVQAEIIMRAWAVLPRLLLS